MYNGEKTVSSISGVGKTGQVYVKEWVLTSCIKVNSKWIKDLNVRHDTIKVLEENKGRTFFDINHSNIFFILSLKAKEIRVKIFLMGPNYILKLWYRKGNHWKNEKTTYRTGKNICKWWLKGG